MKTLKRYLLPILFTLCLALFGAGLFCVSAKTVKADSTFTLSGASIRYVSDGDDQGIRFVANANKEEFNALAEDNENLSVKMVIASLPNVKNAGINPEELDVNSAIFKHVISVYEKEDGNVTMNIWSEDVLDSNILTANIYIWRIPEEAYQLFWVARIYYTTGSETGYSDNIINKSMSEVALDNYEEATPEQKEKLDEFMKNYTVTWLNTNGTTVIKSDSNQKYGATLSAPSVAPLSGYNAVWYKRTGTDGNDNPVWSDTPYDVTAADSLVRSDTQLKLVYETIDYDITYNGLVGPYGTETANNPVTYNVKSSTITIEDPTETKNYFLGWTFAGQSTPVKNPTIPAGSIGDKTFTANWGDFTAPDDDYIYIGYYGLVKPKAVSGYGVTENDVIYTVNNNTVVSISGNKITSVATGSVTVTARLGVISKTFTVTVKATSEGDDAASPRTMDTDLPRHRNNMQGLSVFNYSGDLTLFMGASFMDERNFFTDFYTTRYPTKNAFLLGVAGSRTTHWRFFVQDYLSYAPKNIVLGVGGNDLFSGGFSAEDVTNNLERIFEVIHDALPSTNVYWWTSADRYNNAWQKQQEDKISAFNAGVRSYAEDKDWLTVVETRSLLTTQADYKETSGIRLHPSIPTGYDKCMQATVDAGLVLTDNAYAATNIVKDWTSINGTDDFGTVKVLGIQARATNFVWESDVTIKNFSNTGAKGHITINWKSVTAINGKTNGQNNRFVILNRNGDGRFFFSGNTASSGAWSADDAEYLTAVSGTDKTFRLAILATDKNAYMFIDGVLYATYRNITLENVKSDATYYAFRVGGELATVKFENNKISNPYINSANYNSYLENATVAANEGDTTLSSAKILYRKVTFNVYNDAHFTANGVSLNFTDTANNASYGETVENNKVSFVTGAAGEMIGKTYNVTANFTGLTASVYNGATVTHDGDNYLISGDTFSFSGMFANSNVTSWTSEGSAEVDLYNGVYKKLSGSVENNFALKVNITGSFYAAVYMKGDITSTAAETRFGFNYSGSNGNGGVTFLKNANKTFIGVQNMTYWKWYIDVDNETSESLSRTVLKNDGYWLIMHQDSSTGTRTVYVSDSTCNYLIRVAMTRTSDYYKNATVTQFGIDFWQNAFVMSASSFRVGATLQAALNKTVDISVTNTANCTATVSADSVAAGNEVTFAISPDKTYQVSSVTMNGIDITGTLNKGTFTFIALKDTVFTPAITFVGNKISIQDKTISGHGSGNKIDAYNGRIGLIGFTWQGFMGFPSGTSLDLSASAKWNVVVSFDTENGKAIQVQLLRWNGVVYIKAFINDSTNNAVRIDTNADLYAKLIADKGLTVRVIFDGDNISTYALGGENYNAWYKIHSNYQIANEGTYVNKISYYKDLSDIASLSAIVKEAAITTYKDAPTSWAVADATNSGSGTVSETTICTVPNYNENVFTWAGYIGFNVTDVSLFTDTAMWYSQVTFKDSANANVLALQLLGYNGNHYSKLQGSGLGNNTMSYKFHDVGGTNVGSYETYLTANGKLYISIAYDSLNKTASMWIRDNSGLLNKVYSDVTLPSCSGNKIATITWNSVGSPLSKVSASFVKGQSISFIDTTTPGEGGDFNTSELANYKIVYDADYPELNSVATTLRNNISSKYGIALPVGSDTATSVSDYEILIGDTNRYSVSGKIMQYSVTVDGAKLKINAGGMFSAEKAVEFLNQNVFTGSSVSLNSGTYYNTSLITNTQAITAGSTARIMSANILADAFNDPNFAAANYRAEIFAGVLVAYKPDVIGAQETDNNWNSLLGKYLEKASSETGYTYARYLATYENKLNYTSLIYRADKYNVTATGVKVFTWWTDPAFNHGYHMRNVSWAQFTSKTNSSEKFVLANTHWSYRLEHVGDYLYGSSTPIQTDELRTQCKNETNTLLATLRSNYNMPIFLTGDFNTSLPYFTSYGWLASNYNVLSEQATQAGTCITPVPTSNHFDHIMGTGSYTVKRFDLIKNVNYGNLLSDHSLVYADVAF